MQNICTVKHLYSRYPLVCSSQTLKGLRAQSFPIQLHTPHIIAPPYIKKPQKLRPPVLARTRSDSLGLDEPGRDRLENQKFTDTRSCGGSGVYHFRLYQISPFHVKKNLLISTSFFQHPQKYLIPQFIAGFLFGRRRLACPELVPKVRSRRSDAIISN